MNVVNCWGSLKKKLAFRDHIILSKVARATHRKWKTFVFISKFCSVTYLDFLHASIIHDGTSIKSFGESYLVQFSVNCKTPFFDVSATLDNFVMHVTKLKHLGRFKRWSAPNKEEHELFKSLNLFFLQDKFVSYWLLRGQNRNSAYKPFENSYRRVSPAMSVCSATRDEASTSLLPVLLITSLKASRESFILSVGSHDVASLV